MKIFRRIAAVIACLWSSNFGKGTRELICYFPDGQDLHTPHSYHNHSLLRHSRNLVNLVIPQVFAYQSGTANKIFMKNYQRKSKVKMYLRPEHNKKKKEQIWSHNKCFLKLKFQDLL